MLKAVNKGNNFGLINQCSLFIWFIQYFCSVEDKSFEDLLCGVISDPINNDQDFNELLREYLQH